MKSLIGLAAGLALVLALSSPTLAAGRPGGVFRVGISASTNLDPGFATSPPDNLIVAQIYERLIDIDNDFNPTPGLASSWSSLDGKVWTFNLRPGAVFCDGSPVTAKDVVWTFNRLRDPKIGSPVVSLFEPILGIQAEGDQTVVFTLRDTNPEFPMDAGEYHTGIVPDGTTDPAEKNISSGAYMVKQFLPEDRIILAKNPHFRLNASDGSPLPKFDEVHFIFSPDIPGQVEALRGGDLDFVGFIPSELAQVVQDDPTTQLLLGDENGLMIIHMRADGDRPAKDVRVRQALKLGTNHEDIIAAVLPGLAEVGNDTPVGPPYKDYYLDQKPAFDPAKAKALLKEAGFENGLEIELIATDWGTPQIATVWAQQMSAIGVKVNIKVISNDIYYTDGPDNWLQCDFGVTPWGSRATPVTYYKLAFTSESMWNSCHWYDTEFDEIVKTIDTEMDKAKRIELYKKSQEIFIERAPAINVFVQKTTAAASNRVENLKLGYAWITTRFWEASFK
jgi:peptide/nickel transport system substrate-binding protein